MCGRFSIISNSRELAEHYNLVNSAEIINSYNVTPSSNIPVIRLNDNKRELANCMWGFIPSWAKDPKIKPINAKAESLSEKPYFRASYKNKRCLIPANGYYEWKGTTGNKQPYYFKMENDHIFSFAGLWDHWQNETNSIDSCAIITTIANNLAKPIHHRMPVILSPDDYDDWLLDGDKSLLKPFTGKMLCYPVSKAVNNPGHDGKKLIQPVDLQ